MAIIDIYIQNEYTPLIRDVYRIFIILVLFHIILSNSNCSKLFLSSALTGNMMNNEFIELLIYLIISVCGYYLVFDKLVEFY